MTEVYILTFTDEDSVRDNDVEYVLDLGSVHATLEGAQKAAQEELDACMEGETQKPLLTWTSQGEGTGTWDADHDNYFVFRIRNVPVRA